MAIVLKRIYEAAGADDGCRVLVDRVWPRGVSKSAAALDDWHKEVAPSTELRKWFGHEPERWEAFQSAYCEELDQCDPRVLDALRQQARNGKLTLLFGARDEQRNQAVVLKAYLEQGD